MRKSARGIAAFALLTFSVACGDEPIGPSGPCDGPVSATAARAAQSQLYFTWAPDCYANELIVLGASTGQGSPVRWWVKSKVGVGGFQSGVFYGSAPAETDEFHPAYPNPYEVGATVNVYDANGNRIGQAPLPAP